MWIDLAFGVIGFALELLAEHVLEALRLFLKPDARPVSNSLNGGGS